MKQLMQLSACFVMLWFTTFTSCEKEKPAKTNKAPIAKAGDDISLALAFCGDDSGIATLDGTASIDPENNITDYHWRQLNGPTRVVIQNPTSAKTGIQNISAGKYSFQLEVKDAYGYLSNDIVLISASASAQDYELEITTEAAYRFYDNFEECYFGCSYNDLIQIDGTSTFLPFGAFNININEVADSATLSDVHNTYFSMYAANGNTYLNGTFSINLKKLIRDGGGPFNGTLKAEQGSAQICNASALNSLPLLNVSGSLDVATGMIKFTIKGKVYM